MVSAEAGETKKAAAINAPAEAGTSNLAIMGYPRLGAVKARTSSGPRITVAPHLPGLRNGSIGRCRIDRLRQMLGKQLGDLVGVDAELGGKVAQLIGGQGCLDLFCRYREIVAGADPG